MKDKLTFRQFILIIIGLLLFLYIISPFLEKLIFNSKYKEMKIANKFFSSDNLDVNIHKFTSSGKDGNIEMDLKKKNSKYKYARVDIIDDEGYIVDKQYINLEDIEKDKYVKTKIKYNALNAKGFNITPTNEEPSKDLKYHVGGGFERLIDFILSIPKYIKGYVESSVTFAKSVDSRYWFWALVIFSYIMI